MLIYYLTYLPALLISAAIAVFIYIKNRKSLTHKVFALIIASFFLWTFFNFLTNF